MAKPLSNKVVFFFILILLTSIATLYNPSIATLFVIFAFGSFIWIILDRLDGKRTILIEKIVNRGKSLLYGFGGWVVAILLSFIVLGLSNALNIFQSQFTFESGIGSIFELLKITQQSLAFAGSRFFEYLAFGLAIPIIETLFFCLIAYEVFIELGKLVGQEVRFNVPLSKINIPTIISFLTIAYGATFYHLSAKGVDNTPALITVFIFFFVSCIIVMLEGQALGSILMHIINNSVSLFLVWGLFTTTAPLVIGAVVGLVLLLVLTRFKFKLEV